jgi:hypothetical protein
VIVWYIKDKKINTMGADGHLLLFDANAIDEKGLRAAFYNCYICIYDREFMGKRFYMVYWDTEFHHHNSDPEGFEAFEEDLVDEWEVWT